MRLPNLVKRSILLLPIIILLGLTFTLTAAQQQENEDGLRATAEMQDSDGNVIAVASFTTTEDGAVRIHLEIEGFTEAAGGERGIHFHEVGECEPPDFESAGDHFNPTDDEHGLLNPEGPHAGDLPNIHFDEEGNASYEVTTQLITLDEGETSIFDDDGTALIIHSESDDYVTDPSGESGDRIACGVVEREREEN